MFAHRHPIGGILADVCAASLLTARHHPGDGKSARTVVCSSKTRRRPINAASTSNSIMPLASGRFEPWESNRWGDAHSGCSRGLVTMQLWHGTLRMVPRAPRTSAVPFPFVPTRPITPPARPQEASQRTADLSRGRATDGEMLTPAALVAW